jgi:hypothetical protein
MLAPENNYFSRKCTFPQNSSEHERLRKPSIIFLTDFRIAQMANQLDSYLLMKVVSST